MSDDNDMDVSSDEERPRTPNYAEQNEVNDNNGNQGDDVVEDASPESKSPGEQKDDLEIDNVENILEEEPEGENSDDNDETSPTNELNEEEKGEEENSSEKNEIINEETLGDENEADAIIDDENSSPKENIDNVSYDEDLLPITDLSVDLTGDEAAIVDDILHSTRSGDLISNNLSSSQVDEVDEEAIETEGDVSRISQKSDKEERDEPAVTATGELIADIFGSSDEDEEFEGFEKDELQPSGERRRKTPKKEKREKKPVIDSDEDEEEEERNEQKEEKQEADQEDEHAEEEQSGEQQDDDKPEENLEKDESAITSLVVPPPEDDSDSDDEQSANVFISDFDLMMQQKKDSRKIHRKRKDVDIINDNDDLVMYLISSMKEAAEEDKLANKARQAATKKLVLLPTVLKHMLKIHLMTTFLDCNVLPVLKEWLSPLPDNSLPNLQIREGILKILTQLPAVDSGTLKVSGIGKAVMCLFKHPRETRRNKELCGKLISEWSRPIFGVTANFKSISREEREERDYANMSKRRRLSSDGSGGKTPKRIENAIQNEQKGVRPGEKGWCMRARVPAPSNKDYVVRPKSNIDIEFADFSTKSPKKSLNRFEKQKRKMNENKGSAGKQRAVQISLEGNKMAL